MKRLIIASIFLMVFSAGLWAQTVDGRPWSFLYYSYKNGTLYRMTESPLGSFGNVNTALVYTNKSTEGMSFGLKMSTIQENKTISGYLPYFTAREFNESFGILLTLFMQDMQDTRRAPSISMQYFTKDRNGVGYTILNGISTWFLMIDGTSIDLPLDDIPKYRELFSNSMITIESARKTIQ